MNIFFDWFLIGAPTQNFGNISPYNFGIVGIVLSSVIVNFIISILLTLNLRNHDIYLPNFNLLRKILLISASSLVTSSICFSLLRNTNNLNIPFGEFIILIFGSLAFFTIYFLITKFLRVNNFKFLKKDN